MKLSFVIPDTDAFPSGGNIYNSQLIAALKKKGLSVEVFDFEQFKTVAESGDQTFYFIDTLYLNELRGFSKPLKNCFLIVHHLESLDEEWRKEEWRKEEWRKEEGGRGKKEDGEGGGRRKRKEGGRRKRKEGGKEKTEEEFEILRRFDGFLTSSAFTKAYLLDQGMKDKKYIVVPPALTFRPQPRKLAKDKIEALMVANLIERKGILPFLQALQESEIHAEQCRITIAGSTQLEREYAKKCLDLIQQDNRLAKLVHFSGLCDQVKIQKLYQGSNLFISTAFMETFGMALQEAVAHRLPVLAYDGGNASYHVREGVNGFLFDSVQALVLKLEGLIQSEKDFKSLIDRARKYKPYDNYSWEDASEKLIQSLEV